MGFWNLKKNQEKGEESSKSNETKMGQGEKKELTEEELMMKQLIEESISRVLSPDYKLDSVYPNESIRLFQRGKQILHNISYSMDFFKRAAIQYITIWKSITGKPYSDSKLYEAIIQEAVLMLGICQEHGLDYVKLLKENASGKFGIPSIFENPVLSANIEIKFEHERLLREKIEKLKEIVNKPIKYGDTGNSEDEINFDDEFNVFAEKLREQKMDEITIFKLVSRMGELKKQYESVIKHPDRSLLERLESQVLLESYEQVKKQKEEQEEMRIKELEEQTRQIEAGMQVGTVSDSINHIEKDVSTLTWLKIIDGLFGH